MLKEKDNIKLSERIVNAARKYSGVRWVHQGRSKDTGVDCAGLIFKVASDAKTGIEEDNDKVEKLAGDLNVPDNYRRRENGELLLELLEKHMDNVPLDEIAPGDVVALIDGSLRHKEIPRHLAIVTEVTPRMKIIHSSEHGVVEHLCNRHWLSRIHSCWRVRE
jgi:cell wall-associated NlpC family hydrolase